LKQESEERDAERSIFIGTDFGQPMVRIHGPKEAAEEGDI
jgi:hypothetical protein